MDAGAAVWQRANLALGLLLALGGGGAGARPDAGAQDAGSGMDAPGDVAVRDFPRDLGALGAATGDVALGFVEDPTRYLTFDAILGGNPTPDVLEIELYEGVGVFATGFRPGTYARTGAELNNTTCGMCVRLLARLDPQTSSIDPMAAGGTVTLTSVSGSFTGSSTDLTFEHVTIDPDHGYRSTPVNDGCTATAASGSFTAPIPASDGGVPLDAGAD
jgi:hypothetical protein